MDEFTVRNELYEAYVREHYASVRFMDTIGATITALRPGFCELSAPFRKDLGQQHGFFHGGIVATLADTANGHAGLTLVEQGQGLITVEYKINLISPAAGELLIARGEVLKPGRRVYISRSDVFARQNGAEKLCATSLATWAVIPR